MSTHSLPNNGRKDLLLKAGALLVLTFLAYFPVIHAGFIWDDDSMLTGNVFIRAHDGLEEIWFSTKLPDYYPLTSTSLWLEWRLWGLNPVGYHVINVLLHSLSCLLLWRILLLLEIPGAWLGAALFAVHPVNVESVAWIAERKNTLSFLFYCLAIFWFLKSCTNQRSNDDEESKRQTRFYLASLVAFVLSLLSKTSGVMLPVVALLCLVWLNRGLAMREAWKVIPYFCLSLGFGLLTVWVQSHSAIAGEIVNTSSIPARVAISGAAVWFYLYEALWPVDLCFNYPKWSVDTHAPQWFLPAIALIIAVAWLWCFRDKMRGAFFAVSYFVVTLFPVMGFFDIYFHRYSFVADHWQYFSIIAMTAFCGALLHIIFVRSRAFGMRSALICICSGFVVFLAVRTFRQCCIYQDAGLLWADTLRKNPRSWLAHNNLGLLLERQGRLDDAIGHFQTSLQIHPEQAEGENNLGATLLSLGRVDDAFEHFRRARSINPHLALTHHNLATALDRQGKTAEAIAEYQEALRLDPQYVNAHNDLGCLLLLRGNVQEAATQFREALRYNPQDVTTLGNYGSMLVELGKTEEAIGYLEAALRLNPDFTDAHYNLGNAFFNLGKYSDARDQYAAVIKAKPSMALAHYKLGNVFVKLNQAEKAVLEYQLALGLEPEMAEAHYQLATLLASGRQNGESIVHLQAAVRLKPDWLEAINNLAWTYATHTNALYRDGGEAVRLAEHAADLTHYTNAAVLDTLAAAYAQSLQFDKAASVCEKALPLALKQSPSLAEQIQQHQVLYRTGKRLRE